MDVFVSGGPGIDKKLSPLFFKIAAHGVPHMVKSPAQGPSPGLVPAFSGSRLASAIPVPASHSVSAAPGGAIAVRARFNFHFVVGRIFFQIGGVVGDPIALTMSFHL